MIQAIFALKQPMPELHIPPSVQDAVQRRMQHLQPAARRLLTLAAVIGRRFDFVLLQQVAGYDETELLALIKELVAAQLVVEEAPDHFVFRHALTRQEVYHALLGRKRRQLRQATDAAIEGIYDERLNPSANPAATAQVAELAYHFYEASEWAKALAYAWRADEKEHTLYAPRATVEHFTHALTAAQHLAPPPDLTALYRLRGLAYETVGAFEHACADLATALYLAQAAADPQGEWQILLDLGQLWAAHSYGRTGDYFQQALTLAPMLGLREAGTQNHSAPLAHTLNRLGNWYLNVGQPPEALRCHQEALTIFQELNDAPGLAQTYALLGLMVYLAGNPVQGAVYLQQAIALLQTLQERQSLALSLTTLAICGLNGYESELYLR